MKKATVETPTKDLTIEETLDHRKVILLEDIQAKMELVIEGMGSTKVELKREINEFRAEVNGHFEILDTVVREHSVQLQNIDKRFDTVDKRFDAVEAKLDKVGERLDDQETRITNLETVRL